MGTASAESSGLYVYGMQQGTSPSLNIESNTQNNVLMAQQVQMGEYLPVDYEIHNLQQQQQQHQHLEHRHSTSSINTSISSPGSVFNSLAQSSPSSFSSVTNLVVSPLEIMSHTVTPANNSANNNSRSNDHSMPTYMSFEHAQVHQRQQLHLDHMAKITNSAIVMPPTPGEIPSTPNGYPYNMADFRLENADSAFTTSSNSTSSNNNEESSHHSGGQRDRRAYLNQTASKKLRSSISEESDKNILMVPIKMEQQDHKLHTGYPMQIALTGPTSLSNTSAQGSVSGQTGPSVKRKRAARRRLTVNQKIAHNKIEKKYRTNINEKIFGLDDLIAPSFRCEGSSSDEGGSGCGFAGYHEEEDNGNSSSRPPTTSEAGRPNKSKILERAASYIRYLKVSNAQLKDRNQELKYRLAQYE